MAAPPVSPYCALAIEPGCDCRSLAALTSVPGGFSAAELALAATQYAVVAAAAFQGRQGPVTARDPACVAPTGGNVYCRVDIVGGTPPALPRELAEIEACRGARCATLHATVARTCPRPDGGVTAWAQVTGLTDLWVASPDGAVPGGMLR